jgi:hypothetical protein
MDEIKALVVAGVSVKFIVVSEDPKDLSGVYSEHILSHMFKSIKRCGLFGKPEIWGTMFKCERWNGTYALVNADYVVQVEYA